MTLLQEESDDICTCARVARSLFFPEKPAAVVGQEGGFFTDVLSEVAS